MKYVIRNADSVIKKSKYSILAVFVLNTFNVIQFQACISLSENQNLDIIPDSPIYLECDSKVLL